MTRSRKSAIPESDHLYEFGIDLPRSRVYLSGDIDQQLVMQVIKGISQIARQSDDQVIQLVINSEGGDMVQGFALIDYIRSISNPIHGFVLGNCQSAALVILQACQFRIATANSVLMTHRGNRETEFDKQVDRKADQFLAARMGWSLARLDKFHSHDRYMFAAEALQHRLIDAIQSEVEK